jgi:FMN phosphatase YigB (HAD superfamily)
MEIDLNRYKNIIFDLGGVILNIDYNLSVEAFKKLGLPNFQEHFSQASQNHLFDLYEKGIISSDEFRMELKKHFNDSITVKDIDFAWNALLLDLPAQRLVVLENLKETHRTFLLSNTNDIHIQEFNRYLTKTAGVDDLSSYFEKLYLSYKIGMRKPDKEIFEFVLDQNDLNPAETLFIDDSKQHIESASNVGINTYWLTKGETILDLFPLQNA